MAQEIITDPQFRLVRDEEAGAYYLQVGVDGAFRNFSALKLGKLDQLRAQAHAQARTQTTAAPPSE